MLVGINDDGIRFDDGVEREFVLEYAGLQLLEDMEF